MIKFCTDHPRLVALIVVVVTLVLAALLPRVHIDTDPENMLSADDPVRLFQDQMKRQFAVHDMIVVGIVNEGHPDGVFNPESLRKVYELTEFAKTLRGAGLAGAVEPDRTAEARPPVVAPPAAAEVAIPSPLPGAPEMEVLPPPAVPEAPSEEVPSPPVPEAPASPPEEAEERGVVIIDLLAPSTVDRIESGGPGRPVRFSYLMSKPLPRTREECLAVREGALGNPLLNGTVVSADGKAICIYLPITHKDISYKVSRRLGEKISGLGGPEQYHITGLPVAEDTFGHEMFVQMAISAPLAMLVIFLLLFAFFRNPILIISPMIVALVSVVVTMGLLIGLGYTVHVMSSMIPIFIMPIAVLDAVHILSEFFDRYQQTRDSRATILKVMEHLFVPMLYTSLTSAAGFASLALTPIPPVQVFGVFVAFGIAVAWVLTVTFIPAYVMLIPQRWLENFGLSHAAQSPRTPLTRILRALDGFTDKRRKLVLTGALMVVAVAVGGIMRIRVNDNPTKWFAKKHPIRVADRVLNEHFAGTYQAYLVLTPDLNVLGVPGAAIRLKVGIGRSAAAYAAANPDEPAGAVFDEAVATVDRLAAGPFDSAEEFAAAVIAEAEKRRSEASLGEEFAWDDVIQATTWQPFKQTAMLRYVAELQAALTAADPAEGNTVVGKSNSMVDIVKKVHRELRGDPAYYSIPETARGVADCLLQFQNSHTPDDLWHFVTPDYKHANLWLQLKSGDNKDMEAVVAQVEAYVAARPPPVPMRHRWFGLTYINVVWQRKMVIGMLQAFLGSFLVIFILMTVLFHSALWGLLSMVPMTVTIALIYGLIGLAGKDYDMSVAVLSSLTLGLAVDFAIHFLARSRSAVRQVDSWEAARAGIFGEPARAISRNAIVVAVGFLPLLAAPLVPYKTVGMFMVGILAVAAMATLLILPALMNVFSGRLFRALSATWITCNCIACVASSLAAVAFLALAFHSYFRMGWNKLTWASAVLVVALVFACGFLSRRRECRMLAEQAQRLEQEEE